MKFDIVTNVYSRSPALIPKPKDWGPNIDISGFYFLSLANNYQPEPDLAEFLAAGPPPVYIGFGSIVVEDPNAMTDLIFEAVRKTGQRALVSKGWGGFGGDEMDKPDGVFMLGNCPHDWLFKHVSCVVHHGGAGLFYKLMGNHLLIFNRYNGCWYRSRSADCDCSVLR